MAKIDWVEARNKYLQDSSLSYSDIGKQFGVTKTAVEARGKKEGWVELRQSLGEKAYEKFQKNLLDVKSKAQDRHLQEYQNLQALVNRSMEAISNNNFYTDKKGNVIKDAEGKPIRIPPNPFDLEKIAKTLKIAVDGERVVLGLPTTVSGITDGQGDSVWSGFAEMVRSAEKIAEEQNESRKSSAASPSSSESDTA